MFKVTTEERGRAAEKRELAKMKKINITEEEMKELNKIVHSRELAVKDYKPAVIEKKEITYFYCCGTYWPESMQCPVCGNDCNDY